jgi:Mrp family chromosome partitioning ATPase
MTDHEERSLIDWMRLLRDGWPALVACVALGLLVAWAATARQNTAYGAVATMVVSPTRGFLDPADADKLPTVTATVVRLSEVGDVRARIAERYVDAGPTASIRAGRRREATQAWIGEHVSARQVANSSLIDVTGTAGSQTDAVDLTRAAVAATEEAVGRSPAAGEGEPSGITVRAFSAEPQGKVSPTPVRNLLVGGNAGLLVGVVLALALGAMRRRLRGPNDVAAALGTEVLGVVKLRRSLAGADDEGIGEASARLTEARAGRTSIVLLTGIIDSGTIATVAEQVARALAASSRVTVLVEADLRRENGHGRTESGELGLADLLGGGTPPSFMLSEASASARQDSGFAVIHAGNTDVDPAVALRDPRLSQTLEALNRRFDYVLVAGPRAERSAEVIALLRAVDAAIVVTPWRVAARHLRPIAQLGEPLRSRLVGTLVVR